jgi:hypothetical protein
LHGIPILVKDEIDTAGMPTTLGSLVFKDYRPPGDAFVVALIMPARLGHGSIRTTQEIYSHTIHG